MKLVTPETIKTVFEERNIPFKVIAREMGAQPSELSRMLSNGNTLQPSQVFKIARALGRVEGASRSARRANP